MSLLDEKLNRPVEEIKHVHLMGICGTGMAGLAGMLQQLGYRVTGSDNQVYPPMSDFLHALDIPVAIGYRAANLNERPDLVVVGNVITKENPEALALADLDIPYLSFPQALAHFFIAKRTSIVVTGTHGKTTTCSLLASVLDQAGHDPSFMIGGILRRFNSNFRLGRGPCFIAEGDEYDTAFFDKESKFLHYRPKLAIITSLEFDHADIFADLAAIKRMFRKFVALLPADGLLVANGDDANVVEVVAEAPCPVQFYGTSPGHFWQLASATPATGGSIFSIMENGQPYANMQVSLSGRHNCLNSLAVTAVLDHLGLSAESIDQGLRDFCGVKRRQEVRGIENDVVVIDDFAHHPTAVRETLAGLKTAYPDRRLVTVFEPRTNSSRRAVFQQEYVTAFDSADLVLLREPVPLASLPPQERFSSARLAADLIRERKLPAEALADTDALLARLGEVLKAKDVVAILSNGGFDNIHLRLLEQLRQRC
jgi:UDP-N-acetylmuramate: L-alanyl-gamma-D-glutamyl-meso-diaminopimelate ligase